MPLIFYSQKYRIACAMNKLDPDEHREQEGQQGLESTTRRLSAHL